MSGDYGTRLERVHNHLAAAAELADRIAKDFGRDATIAKTIDATETATLASDRVARPQTVTLHEREHEQLPDRVLGCTHCGATFRVSEASAALSRKRRLQAGLPADDANVLGALKAGATGKGYGRVQ